MWGTCKIVNFLTIVFNSCDWSKSFNTKKTHPFKVECKCIFRGGSTIFLGGDALVSCSTSTPINHIIFFCRIPVVLENRRSSQGGGRAHPLHPPPTSAAAHEDEMFKEISSAMVTVPIYKNF